ncbi:hypothetical protein DMUE_6085 [Dictyocoela muelleri]|nr:hypothetical protein DMUE_6085 [Dictyocoela muelleri]
MYLKTPFRMYRKKIQEIKIWLIQSNITFIAPPKPISNYTRSNRYELGCEDLLLCDYLNSRFVNRNLIGKGMNDKTENGEDMNIKIIKCEAKENVVIEEF